MVSETLDFDGVDYYSESALVDDPFPFFEHLRSKGPVVSLPHHGVVAVTGYEEAVQGYKDAQTFSSLNGGTGPFPPPPFAGEADEIRREIGTVWPHYPMKSP